MGHLAFQGVGLSQAGERSLDRGLQRGLSLTRAHRERLCVQGARLKVLSAKLNGLGFVLWAVGTHGRLGAKEEHCQVGHIKKTFSGCGLQKARDEKPELRGTGDAGWKKKKKGLTREIIWR